MIHTREREREREVRSTESKKKRRYLCRVRGSGYLVYVNVCEQLKSEKVLNIYSNIYSLAGKLRGEKKVEEGGSW